MKITFICHSWLISKSVLFVWVEFKQSQPRSFTTEQHKLLSFVTHYSYPQMFSSLSLVGGWQASDFLDARSEGSCQSKSLLDFLRLLLISRAFSSFFCSGVEDFTTKFVTTVNFTTKSLHYQSVFFSNFLDFLRLLLISWAISSFFCSGVGFHYQICN